MTTTRPRASRGAATTALAALTLAALGACGGDESAGVGFGARLAHLAPATAPLYFETAIRPEGDLKTNLDGLVKRFAPDQDVDRLVTKVFAGSSDRIDYARDVKPWLGERVGVALTGLPQGGKGDVDLAAIIETTDADKALATLRKSADAKLQDRVYNGVKYLYDGSDKSAGAIIDDTLVVGTEPSFKAVVDASKGEGLDANPEFAKVVDAVDDDAAALAYGDVNRAFELVKGSAGGPTSAKDLESVRELLDRRGLKTFAASLVATSTSGKFRFAAATKGDGGDGAAAETLAALPAGSWAALGLGDLGKGISDALDTVASLAGTGFDVRSGLDQLKSQAGIDVQKDLLSWMGQTGLFVRGTSLTDIGGAIVVQSKDTAATKAALAKARTLAAGAGLPAQDLKGPGIDDGFTIKPAGAPFEVFAALAGQRFVLALGRSALDEAIDPTKKLEDDDAYKAAAEQLGDGLKPTFFLDFPKVSGLIGLAAGDDPDYARLKPYLDKITTIVAGSKRDGDLQLLTLSVGVR